MKRKKIALYDPYLDTLGGGEKYALSLLKALEKDYDPVIFWDKDLTGEIKNRFNLSFQHVTFQPNIFRNKNLLQKTFLLKEFDIFIYVTDGSYFFSGAKKNIVYAMVPDKKLYRMTPFNRLKLSGWKFITHSRFNQKHLKKWRVDSTVLYPFIDETFFASSKTMKKEKIILSVGRFFDRLHTKRQDEMISQFQKLKSVHSELKDFTLILAGGLKNEDSQYFDNLKKLVRNDSSIILKPNVSFSHLIDLYRKSLVYWHFTGFGIDENLKPELVEHLGITPLEAMASGCLTFCYDAGGPHELIQDGKNGFLFKSNSDLEQKMMKVLHNPEREASIRKSALASIQSKFSYDVFVKNVCSLIQ